MTNEQQVITMMWIAFIMSTGIVCLAILEQFRKARELKRILSLLVEIRDCLKQDAAAKEVDEKHKAA
jgi:hypothetical protein